MIICSRCQEKDKLKISIDTDKKIIFIYCDRCKKGNKFSCGYSDIGAEL